MVLAPPARGARSEAGYRAVAFDQRGYSAGARPADMSCVPHRSPRLGRTRSVADALGIERFDLVGHDWGGMVAWVYAVLATRSACRTLTVVSTPHPSAFGAALCEQ